MKRMQIRSRGFTLIELTVTLALAVVFMGLVIVRFSWGSPRQQTIAEGRKLGNLIETYREKAVAEERLYALRIDAEQGQYAVYQPAERRAGSLDMLAPLRSGSLPGYVAIKAIRKQADVLASPVVFYFDSRGVLPDLFIDLIHKDGAAVSLHLDPLQNEVTYDER
ncbi:MAG: prepilin-type N-terminal cleavage/methylation domain-containing protein [Planctomycetes bacterium]|nr:prepilin-type N-terminal cleavage/methylation domain-containing protein [Planctomycetota bacterium]